MRLISVNIGKAQTIQNAKASGQTGIYKRHTEEAVRVTYNGLVGDTICDTENHGGVDQAVYVYGTPDYAWWSEHLGQELLPGTFGENLTITELESAALQVGDYLRVGTMLLQVTAPRIPCMTLAVRMEDPAFLKRFRRAERPGVYCRVLQEGQLQVGDEVTLQPYDGETLSTLEMFRNFFEPKLDERRFGATSRRPSRFVPAKTKKQTFKNGCERTSSRNHYLHFRQTITVVINLRTKAPQKKL